MANPIYPASLPFPLDTGAAYEPLVENVASTNMETGAPKRRRRFTAVPETFTGSIRLDATQYATLKAFVEVTLADVGVFDWIDHRTTATATYYFKSRPKYTYVTGSAGLWDASLELVQL